MINFGRSNLDSRQGFQLFS